MVYGDVKISGEYDIMDVLNDYRFRIIMLVIMLVLLTAGFTMTMASLTIDVPVFGSTETTANITDFINDDVWRFLGYSTRAVLSIVLLVLAAVCFPFKGRVASVLTLIFSISAIVCLLSISIDFLGSRSLYIEGYSQYSIDACGHIEFGTFLLFIPPVISAIISLRYVLSKDFVEDYNKKV